ncbi:CbtB domain-containing protein [Motiliproteus sp. SC1-56]|uniref:CbtB domain-containing protein n=1 Tax=Motiliproteus sp. SC1-56 TaxID=2799565 RepID=UPI001A8F4D8D|nr:CbtB domain-containing protein [Motiliproteus sp. SC1-56]
MRTSPRDSCSGRNQPSKKSLLTLAGLGLVLVLLTGFTPLNAIHSTSHDVRHALGIPCH